MPRAVFFHDHVFRPGPEGKVWTSGALQSSLWSRYLGHFDMLGVVGRAGAPVSVAPDLARADAEGVTFRLLPSVNGLSQSARRPGVRREIGRIIRQSDAVIARLPSEFGFIACNLAHKHRRPLLVEVVGSPLESLRMHGSWIARLYAPIADRRMRAAVARAPFVIYVTRSWLQRLYPSSNPPLGEQEGSAQAGIADALIELPDAEARALRESRLRSLEQGRTPVFGTIATLATRYKGLQFAIPAFARLRQEGHRFTYRIMGPGNPEPWQRLIDSHALSDCCFLDGPRPAGEPVLAWIDALDVHVQPSLTESLGRAQIEAMSRGAACISSTGGGMSEYVDARWAHAPGDIDALTGHLRQLMQEPALVRSLSQSAFATVIQQFDPQALHEKRSDMIALLSKAAARG